MNKIGNSLVSFIIPVYNSELYLPQCIDSILEQTYSTMEVILVDDGSVDKSGNICDEYAEKDSRVKVIHKMNGGASQARNIGLLHAKGEYIIFADSDDFWVGTESLQILMEEFKTECDCEMLIFNMFHFYPSQNKFRHWQAYNKQLLQCTNKSEVIIFLVASGTVPMSPCSKILKREFLLKNEIYFPENTVGEDIPWFIELLHKTKTIKFVNQYIYAYRKEVASSVSTSFSEKKYNDLFFILKDGVKTIQIKFTDRKGRNALLSFMAYEYCILMGTVNNFPTRKRKQQIKELEAYKWLLQYELNPKVRKAKLLLRLTGAHLTRWALFFYIKKRVNRS